MHANCSSSSQPNEQMNNLRRKRLYSGPQFCLNLWQCYGWGKGEQHTSLNETSKHTSHVPVKYTLSHLPTSGCKTRSPLAVGS